MKQLISLRLFLLTIGTCSAGRLFMYYFLFTNKTLRYWLLNSWVQCNGIRLGRDTRVCIRHWLRRRGFRANGVEHIGEVTLRRAGLVPRWVTARRYTPSQLSLVVPS